MMYLGDYAANTTVDFMWSSNGADGASITRSTNGTISVYKANGTTQTTTGVTDTEDFDSLTGIHHCRIATTDAFYATGNDFMVVLSAATIDTKTVNSVLALFSIQNRYNPTPPTVGAIADQVWDEVQSGHTTAGTFGKYLDTQVSTPPTAGAIADAVWDEVQTGHTTASTFGKYLDAQVSAAAAPPSAAAIADAVWDEDMVGHTTAGTTGELLEAATIDWTIPTAEAVWNALLSAHTDAGSAGKALSDAATPGGGIVDVISLGGDTTALTNMKHWFNGTGYSGPNNSIGEVGEVLQTVTADIVKLGGSTTDLQLLVYLLTGIVHSVVAAGTNTTTVVTTALPSSVSNFYVGKTFVAISGANAKQGGKLVTAYDGATKRLTIEALTAPMTALDEFILVG